MSETPFYLHDFDDFFDAYTKAYLEGSQVALTGDMPGEIPKDMLDFGIYDTETYEFLKQSLHNIRKGVRNGLSFGMQAQAMISAEAQDDLDFGPR